MVGPSPAVLPLWPLSPCCDTITLQQCPFHQLISGSPPQPSEACSGHGISVGKIRRLEHLSLSKLPKHYGTFLPLLQKPSNSAPFRMTLPSGSSTLKPNTTGLGNKDESWARVTAKTKVGFRQSSISFSEISPLCILPGWFPLQADVLHKCRCLPASTETHASLFKGGEDTRPLSR